MVVEIARREGAHPEQDGKVEQGGERCKTEQCLNITRCGESDGGRLGAVLGQMTLLPDGARGAGIPGLPIIAQVRKHALSDFIARRLLKECYGIFTNLLTFDDPYARIPFT
jgi:hypothetical protein